MYKTFSLVAVLALTSHALVAPNPLEVEKRALSSQCNHDNLYRSFVDPRYSASASAFCSTYIQPTTSTTTTVTSIATVTSTAKAAKRDLSATTAYPASRLSSACSCILTATPSPTTYIATVTASSTTTTTITPTSLACQNPSTIVQNGDFETGALAPWTLLSVTPPLPQYSQYLTVGVAAGGYSGSNYAFKIDNEAASSYVEVDLGQDLTVCAGQKYNFAAYFYMTDSFDTPKQTYVTVYADGNTVAASKVSDGQGPPIVWLPLSGSFTAGSAKVQLKVSFVATDYLGVKWGLDNVVVTPA